MARPSPNPAWPAVSRPRWKRSKIASRSSGCTPGPSSRTLIVTTGSRLRTHAHLEIPRGWRGPRCRAGCAGSGRCFPGPRAPTPRRRGHPALERISLLLGADLELGEHGAAELAELHRLRAQLDLGVDPREIEQVGGQTPEPAGLGVGALARAPAHPPGRGGRRCRSSWSSSSIPSSEVSGVRSSCEAVATNARRASSCWRSRCCIRASVRARSPTSSWARSTGISTAGPPWASSRAASRSRLQPAHQPRRQRDAEDQRQGERRPARRPGTRGAPRQRRPERRRSTCGPPGRSGGGHWR